MQLSCTLSAAALLALPSPAGARLQDAAAAPAAADLLAPVRIAAQGRFIDTEIGHAAPCVADFDDDGVDDLLVGQFGGGVLWIYRNVGTNAAPQLAEGVKFQDGRPEGTVPTG